MLTLKIKAICALLAALTITAPYASAQILTFDQAKQRADQGDAFAQAVVALHYQLGWNTQKNPELAVKYAIASAEARHPLGQFRLGALLRAGEGVPKDEKQGLALQSASFNALYESQDPYSMTSAAIMIFQGKVVGDDVSEDERRRDAAALYKKAADMGYAPAQFNFAMCAEAGHGMRKDPQAREAYLRRAASDDYPLALKALQKDQGIVADSPAIAATSGAEGADSRLSGSRTLPPTAQEVTDRDEIQNVADIDGRISVLKSRINAHHERGEDEEATVLCEEVLRLTKKRYAGGRLPPEESMEIAQARLNLSQFYKFVGRFADAEQLFLDQVEDWKNIPDWHAQASSNLGDLYIMIGDYESAMKPVLAGLSAKMNGFAGQTGVYDMFEKEMNDSLLVLYESGLYEQAAKMAEQAIQLCERSYGSDSGPFNDKFALPRSILVRSRLRLGQPDGLEHVTGRVGDAMRGTIQSTLKNEPLPRLKHIGLALLETGDAETAAYVFEGASPQVDLLLPQSGELLDGYAWSLLKKKDPERNKALLTVRQSVQAKNAIMPRVHRFSERRRVLWQVSQLQFALPAAVLPDREFAEVVVAWKGSTAESILRESRRTSALSNTGQIEKVKTLERMRANLEAATYAGHSDTGKLEEQVKSLEREILADSRDVTATDDEVPGLDAVQAALGPDEAVLEFAQLAGEPGQSGEPDYAALIITAENIKRCPDISGPDVALAVKDFYARLDAGTNEDIEATLRNLNSLICSKALDLIPAGCRRLYVCADGALHLVPFAVLMDSGRQFLGDKISIAYLNSSRDLAKVGQTAEAARNGKTIALFANPTFSRGGATDASLPPLPGADKECEEVGRVLGEAGYKVGKLAGDAATEQSFKQVESPTILHVATHGFLAGATSPGAQGVRGMAVKGVVSVDEEKDKGLTDDLANPTATRKQLTDESARTVLAFAGAEDSLQEWLEGKYPDPSADGIITPAEAAAMNLDGTWIVALSACQSGRGDAVAGEGVFGLRRAFMVAGADSLLMTLWPVADETTAGIMKDFYTEIAAKGDVVEALSVTQRNWLGKLREERGLSAAVREAGPFAAALMSNPKSGFTPVSNAKKPPTMDDEIAKLEESAGLGDSDAMVALGFIYGKGEGVAKDREKALEWYRKAFKAGNLQGAIGTEALLFPVNDSMSAAAKRLRAAFDSEENE